MKTKLLKKIRNRFDWGFMKDGTPVIVDYKKKKVFKVDEEFIKENYGPDEGSVEEHYKIDLPTLSKRIALTELGKSFGWHYSMPKKRFRKGSRKIKAARKEGKVILN